MKKINLLALSAGLALAGNASAQSIVQNVNLSLIPTGSQGLLFNEFNTQGGSLVLNSVTVSIAFSKAGGSYEVDNDSATSGVATLSHSIQGALDTGDYDLTKVGGGIVGFPASKLKATSTTSVFLSEDKDDNVGGTQPNGVHADGGTDYFFYSPGTVAAPGDSGSINNTMQFEGTGTFAWTFSADQLVSITGIGGVAQAFNPSGLTGLVTLTYNYSPAVIPEPSAALLGALGAAFLFRRRRA